MEPNPDNHETHTPQPRRRSVIRSLAIGSLVALAILAYLPAAGNGFVWDDDSYITHSRHERSLSDLIQIWIDPWSVPQYYPLVHTSFWIEYHLWGTEPLGYHLVNILLHGLSAGLVFGVLKRLRIPGGAAAAWVVAAIFAVHPVHVETVAWATERKNVLSTTLALASLLACLRFYRIGDRPEDPPQADPSLAALNRAWYPIALLLYMAALWSKTVAASVPGVIVLILWWKHGCLRARTIGPVAPFILFGALLGWLTTQMEKYHVGAIGQDWNLSIIERGLVAGRALWFYVVKLCWPHPLMFNYPRWSIDAGSAWQYVPPLTFLAALLGLAALLPRLGKGPLVAMLIFVGVLTPALGFFDVYPMRYSFVADHFVYAASMGIIALAVTTAAVLIGFVRSGGRVLGILLTTILLAALGATTWNRCHDFADSETLWLDTLDKNPDSIIACLNLGAQRQQEGKLSEAEAYFQQAIQARDDHPLTHKHLASFHLRQGHEDRALNGFRKALSLYRGYEPERGLVHTHIGLLLAQRGEDEQAVDHFQKALACRANDMPTEWVIRAYHGLGLSLLDLGRASEAAEHWRTLLKLKPDHASAQYHLGLAYQRLGQPQEATHYYFQAIQLEPDHAKAHNNLGTILAISGQPEQAIVHFQAAVQADSQDVNANLNLGLALADLGRRDEAVARLEQALSLQPDLVRALRALARVIASGPSGSTDQYERAVRYAQRACELTQHQDLMSLDALAYTYARAGRADEAAKVADQAESIARTLGGAELAEQIRQRLDRRGNGQDRTRGEKQGTRGH